MVAFTEFFWMAHRQPMIFVFSSVQNQVKERWNQKKKKQKQKYKLHEVGPQKHSAMTQMQ